LPAHTAHQCMVTPQSPIRMRSLLRATLRRMNPASCRPPPPERPLSRPVHQPCLAMTTEGPSHPCARVYIPQYRQRPPLLRPQGGSVADPGRRGRSHSERPLADRGRHSRAMTTLGALGWAWAATSPRPPGLLHQPPPWVTPPLITRILKRWGHATTAVALPRGPMNRLHTRA